MTIAALPYQRAQASVSELAVSEPADQDLVERAQRGDAWAEEALFRRHVGRVAQLAAHLLGRTAEADDVVQDSFVIALEHALKVQASGRDTAEFADELPRLRLAGGADHSGAA